MCDLDEAELDPLEEDQYVLDTDYVRSFVERVRRTIAGETTAEAACEALRPAFTELLARRDWLPEEFQRDVPASGMGGGIGQWLLFRAADRSLSLFSLVVPPGQKTPIHDHLAWGLIGIYRGNQDEEIYRPGEGVIELVRQRPLGPGDHCARRHTYDEHTGEARPFRSGYANASCGAGEAVAAVDCS